MIKRLVAFIIFFNCAVSFAQTIKTDVLVIGGSPSGIAAAIQCARSKVKTVLVEEGSTLCPQLSGKKPILTLADHNWPGGIWAEFRNHVIDHYHSQPGYDTTYNANLKLEDTVAAAILTRMADTVKNLSVQLNTSFVKIVKDDDRWDVSLTNNGNRETIKARVIIDATSSGAIMTNAGGSWKLENTFWLNYDNDLYRTSISMGDEKPSVKGDTSTKNIHTYAYAYDVPVKALLAKGVENLLVTGVQYQEPNERYSERFIRADLTLGQGAGVTAAYCAFFKTTTANLNVRMIQGELLDFKGDILPVHGNNARDPYWRAIQQVCATGLLKPVVKYGELAQWVDFCPDSIVTTAEIKPAMLELYTRSFIWFNKEKPGAQFTIGNLLSFISELTLTDPDNLQKSIGKAWTEQFHFTSTFDPDRPVTRREFAILANKYLNPFGRRVDLDGRVMN